jgi:hypothetical protein
VRRCNRTRRGVPCCNRSRKRPAPRRKGSQRQSVEGRAASGWAQRRCRAAEGDDEVGAVCRCIRTSLGCCMRCAQSAAGESPPNPKVQHVHYDTGPRVMGNRRACVCCGVPARKRPVFQISQNIAHPGRTKNSTPGPMSVLPRQFNQRSYHRVVEYMRRTKNVHTQRSQSRADAQAARGGRLDKICASAGAQSRQCKHSPGDLMN